MVWLLFPTFSTRYETVQMPVADTLYALNDFHNPKTVEPTTDIG